MAGGEPAFSWGRWFLGLAIMAAGVVVPLTYVVMSKNRKAFAKAATKFT